MVQSYVLMRSNGTGVEGDAYGPRQADLQPYLDMANGPQELQLEDMSGRANIHQAFDPRVVLIHINAMRNDIALAMQSDPKLWMVASRRLEANEDGELEVVDNNYNDVYTAQERATRITQLSNFTDFDADQIANWWTPDKTRREVAEKLWKYIKTAGVES